MAEIEIRILTEADDAAWWNLRSLALSTEPMAFGKSLEEHQQTPVETIANRFRNRSNDNFTLGAFAGGELVGMVTFVRSSGIKECHKGWIYGVFVRQENRGAGVANALIAALLKSVRTDSSIEQIHLASSQESARRLYRSFGFQTYGIEPRSLKVNGVYLDEEHMLLRL